MTQSQSQKLTPAVANLVAENNRLSFLPTFFGQHLMIRGEALVFGWLDRLSEDYNGGYWHFYTLTNGGFYLARRKADGFRVGQRCEIVSVHHPVFAKEIGKQIIITKVSQGTRQVWAHDDKPPKYRINRNGNCVIDYDPRCIQSIYGFDNLRILNI